MKVSRGGKASAVQLYLSADERLLVWQKQGLIHRRKSAEERAVLVSEIADVTVGRDSDAFRRASPLVATRLLPHLSLSIRMKPSRERVRERKTLDLCLADEEHFGLLVKAVRALVAEHAERVATAEHECKPWGGRPPSVTTCVD